MEWTCLSQWERASFGMEIKGGPLLRNYLHGGGNHMEKNTCESLEGKGEQHSILRICEKTDSYLLPSGGGIGVAYLSKERRNWAWGDCAEREEEREPWAGWKPDRDTSHLTIEVNGLKSEKSLAYPVGGQRH